MYHLTITVVQLYSKSVTIITVLRILCTFHRPPGRGVLQEATHIIWVELLQL